MPTYSGTSVLSADLQTYFASELLNFASYNTVFKNYGNMTPIPAGSSKTISFTQYTQLTPPTGTLTEGVTPTENVLATTAITAVVDQVGDFVYLTDLGELTVKHPVVQKTLENLGQSAGRSYDNRIQAVLVAGTNVIYAGGVANRAALANANVASTAEFKKAAKLLRTNGAMPFEDGNFVMVVDPSVEMDILSDTAFTNAAYYSQVERLNAATVGKWFGITVVRSNNIATIASTATVHTSYVFAKNAYAVTDLQNLSVYVEGPGGTVDPLHQRKTLGFKYSMKAVILNQAYMVRVESGSLY